MTDAKKTPVPKATMKKTLKGSKKVGDTRLMIRISVKGRRSVPRRSRGLNRGRQHLKVSYYASPIQILLEDRMSDAKKKPAPKTTAKKTLKGGKKISGTKLMFHY